MKKAYPSTAQPVNREENADSERLIKTAAHVCEILDCFAAAQPALTHTEITERVGLRGSSIHRLLRTLVAYRYLAQDPATRRYRLGEQLAKCCRVFTASLSISSISRPFLECLRAATDETVTLQTRIGAEREIVAQVESTQSVRAVIDDSHRYPLDAGAAGHVLRAFSSEWQTFADHENLRRIRKAGYAVSRGEVMPGVLAICYPVKGADGLVNYVVGVQGPEYRLTDKVTAVVSELRTVAEQLGMSLPPEMPRR